MRNFRNVVVVLLLLAVLLGIAFYLSGAMFVLLVWGIQYLDASAIKPSLVDFPNNLWPTIFDYVYGFFVDPKRYSTPVRIKLLVSFFTPIGLMFLVFWFLRAPILEWRPFKKKESLHGDARWAVEADIRKAGLRSKEGVLLGRDKKGFLIAGGTQHILMFAPTGSGKGVSTVIPNLLMYAGSVIVHDIKLENFNLTSGWRHKKGNEVFCWCPADPNGLSHCYNPLDWVSEKPGQMVDDVQKIANLLMPEQDFWVNEARSLFLGVVLYLIAVPEKITSFGEVVRTMRSDDVSYNLAVALDTLGDKIHPVGYMNIAAFLQKAEKERSGVVSTMNSSLELWANPLIDTATATSDFDFSQMKRHKTSVFVGLTPDNLIRLRPLMQVFYQQAVEKFCKQLPGPDEPHSVLFLLDEFPTLGKLDVVKDAIAFTRAYRAHFLLITQSPEQMTAIYEQPGMLSFFANCSYRLTFAANDMETANLISQMVGNKTVEQESLNKPKFLDFNPASRSLHVSETQRALLLPQEVMMLPSDDQILLVEANYPIRSKKIRYYKEKFFTKRLIDPTFVPTQVPFDPKKYAEDQKKVAEEHEGAKATEELGSGAVEAESTESEDERNVAGGQGPDNSEVPQDVNTEYDDQSEEVNEEDDALDDEEVHEEYEDDDDDLDDEEHEDDDDDLDDEEEYEDDDLDDEEHEDDDDDLDDEEHEDDDDDLDDEEEYEDDDLDDEEHEDDDDDLDDEEEYEDDDLDDEEHEDDDDDLDDEEEYEDDDLDDEEHEDDDDDLDDEEEYEDDDLDDEEYEDEEHEDDLDDDDDDDLDYDEEDDEDLEDDEDTDLKH